MVGRDVLIPSNFATYTKGSDLNGAVKLPADAKNVSVEIRDKNGALIKTLKLGDAKAGNLSFKWNGLSDNGSVQSEGLYAIKATGEINGQSMVLGTSAKAKVESVTMTKDGSGLILNVKDIGAVPMKNIEQIL